MSRRIRIGSLIFLSGALAFALALSPAIAAAETESVTLTVTAVAKKGKPVARPEGLFQRPAADNLYFRFLRAQRLGHAGAGFH